MPTPFIRLCQGVIIVKLRGCSVQKTKQCNYTISILVERRQQKWRSCISAVQVEKENFT